MFFSPDRTPYDWSFRVLGIPIRVHPLFWLGTILLGSSLVGAGLHYLLIWVLAVFVSIMLHEFGHALAFRMYGIDSRIVLTLLCGLTIPTREAQNSWRRIFVSLAGPGAGFLLAAGIYSLRNSLDPISTPKIILAFLLFLYWINLYWGILNLLPVWPLDGGQVAQELCMMLFGRHGRRIALEISLAFAGLMVAYSLACEFRWLDNLLSQLPHWVPQGGMWTAILFGMLALQSYQLLQLEEQPERYWGE